MPGRDAVRGAQCPSSGEHIVAACGIAGHREIEVSTLIHSHQNMARLESHLHQIYPRTRLQYNADTLHTEINITQAGGNILPGMKSYHSSSRWILCLCATIDLERALAGLCGAG